MSENTKSAGSEIARRLLEGQRQMLRVQRRLFDNTYQALSALQNQQQAMIDRFVDSSRVPDEARDLVDTWRVAAAEQRGQFRHAVEQSFDSFDHLLQRLARTAAEGAEDSSTSSSSAAAADQGATKKSTKKAAKKKKASAKKKTSAGKKKSTRKKSTRSKKKS